ncbi:MAG: hypothetical protein CMJ75_17360 [Planctomycetaceae bacterium]|nr:hypothetical protein [Planctomycetaceae bacterium]
MASTAFLNCADRPLRTKRVLCFVLGLLFAAAMVSGCTDVDVATTSTRQGSSPEPTHPPGLNTQPQNTRPATDQSAAVGSAGAPGNSSSYAESGANRSPSGDARQPENQPENQPEKPSTPAGKNPSQVSPVPDETRNESVVESATGPADAATAQQIRQAMEALRSESGKIQVVGRALSPAEQTRVKDLAQAIQYLETSLQALVPTLTKSSGEVVGDDVPVNAEQLIDELIKSTDASIVELQVVGRAMTDAELSRARTLLRVADGLRRAVGEIALESTGNRPQPDLLDLLPD